MASLPEQNSCLFSVIDYDTTNMLLDCCPTDVNQGEILQLAQNYMSTHSSPSITSNCQIPLYSFLDSANPLNQNLTTSPTTEINTMNYMHQIFEAASWSANTLSNPLLNFPMLNSSETLIDSMQNHSHLITQPQLWLSYCNPLEQEQQTNQCRLDRKRSRLEIWADHFATEQYRLSGSAKINSIDEILGADSINMPAITQQYESNPQALIKSDCKRRKNSIGHSSTDIPSNPLNPEERNRIAQILSQTDRKYALKEAFKKLVSAVPPVEEDGIRSTNAIVLNRAAQHIRNLKAQSEEREKEVNELNEKIALLNDRISVIQSNNSPTSNGQLMHSQVLMFFERYRRGQSKQDAKFGLMSEILEKLVHSYADDIHPDPSEKEDVLLSAHTWINKAWNLAALRPLASNTLLKLATENEVFTESTSLRDHITDEKVNVHQTSASCQK